MNNSKALWLSVEREIQSDLITLGRYASDDYIHDPKHLGFVASRYKFCASLLRGSHVVLEVGCGDGFGSGIVASTVDRLICTDIN
ncbi:class I SAM-dependent methyltransferase, partial [candidate division KSB3 bacterium]|nr:class I SAM-dependent methyltransferase [candidate division KSB3 bacterium]MBD3324881.1 class I SAM-dependent methyltransferase [candidate division KSB3 bacterium]